MEAPLRLASISDKAFGNGSVRENLHAFRRHGFTHIHFSLFWRAKEAMSPQQIESVKADLADAQLAVLDVHGCHPEGINLWDEGEAREAALALFHHRLHVTHALGGDAIVYHVPTRVEPAPAVIERFVDGLARMEDTARALGLKVALENHFVAENDKRALAAAFERFSDEYIAFTLDPGHANRADNFDWLLTNCMDRLHILHLNDNDVVEDRHWLPGQEGGSVDWERVTGAIAGSPYCKPLQLEVRWDDELHTTQTEFLREAAQKLRHLESEIERGRGSNTEERSWQTG